MLIVGLIGEGSMKRKLKIAVVVIAAAEAFLMTVGRANEPASLRSKPTSGRTLFIQNCSRCHGVNGKAETRLGEKLEASDISGGISTEKIIRIATNGRGEMPSFKRKLTPAQIRSIATYVHSL